MTTLLIATNNKGKILEIQDLLAKLNITLLTPSDLDIQFEVQEDGRTYAENARKKARAFSEASGLPVLADDSGLEVDALEGKPGLHSNRFGPQPSNEVDRRQYLLSQLKNLPRPWNARFVATVAIKAPGTGYILAEGACEGEIIPEERGSGGFGYDPIFFIPAMNQTMAELDMKDKNRISHRAKAVTNALSELRELLASYEKIKGTHSPGW